MSLTRRRFLGWMGAAGAGTLLGRRAEAAANVHFKGYPDSFAVLHDTTLCVGCRVCEAACNKVNELPPPNRPFKDLSVLDTLRRTTSKTYTVVNRFQTESKSPKTIYVKKQCNHCLEPACASACFVRAFKKTPEGAVTYDHTVCVGCRYCMVACPFQVPAFQYDKALNPLIMKCDFCFERTKEGLLPACVSICPVEALTYGVRTDLVKIARERIRRNPDRYVDYIFGEYEVGGTSWMYLANKEFTELDFPKLGEKPAPGVSESIQHGIFAYFVPPVSLYALLGGMMWISKRRKELDKEVD